MAAEANKVLAAIVALMMVATGVVVYGTAQESDANVTDGLATYNFYIASAESEDWELYSADGYNAYIALDAALDAEGINHTFAYDSYTMVVSPGTIYEYTTIDPQYGTVEAIDGYDEDGYSWFVYVYGVNGWQLGLTDALGFYQAYSDYDSNLKTANIALYYSDVSTTNIELPTTGLATIKTVETTGTLYKSTFNFSVASNIAKPSGVSDELWNSLQNGITNSGYGSNAFLALVNANVSATGNNEMWDTVDLAINHSSYGYVDSIFGISENSSVVTTYGIDPVTGQNMAYVQSTWWYWQVSINNGNTSTASDFTLGFMTPLVGLGSGFVNTTYDVVYVESVYNYSYPVVSAE